MIFSPITAMNTAPLIPSRVQSPSFIRKRNLPTPPPSFADVNDSSSCSSSSSSSSSSSVSSTYSTTTTTSSATLSDNNNTVASCDLLNIITDARFRPVFQAIDEIKRRKCRPDLERILKYVGKRYTGSNVSYQRDEILLILDDLLKYGLITKVFHKGGFTIRIKNEKYAKLIEKMNVCYSQKTPTATPMSPHEAVAAAAAAGTINLNDQQWPIAKQYLLNSNEMNNNEHHTHHFHHTRETPSPEFAVFKTESSSPLCSSIDHNNNPGQFPMIKENALTNGAIVIPSTSISSTIKSNNKRSRSQTTSYNESKKSCLVKAADSIASSSHVIFPIVNNSDEHVFRKPLTTYNNLPPITIEQLLGLRGDIPDVHNWSTDQLNEFFNQQGYEYASILLNTYNINGNKLYELKREQVFRMSTLKIGKALKLWNVIEQIQQKSLS